MSLCQFDRGEWMEKIRFPLTFIALAGLWTILFFSIPLSQGVQAGVYHIVKKNETVWSIARAYGVTAEELAKVNDIIDINSIRESTVLFIPSACQIIDDASETGNMGRESRLSRHKPMTGGVHQALSDGNIKSEKPAEKAKGTKTGYAGESVAKPIRKQQSSDKKSMLQYKAPAPEKKISTGRNIFIWPVRGEIKAHFGIQPNKTLNNWIKIASTEGKKVKAAESGTVIFSSHLKSYGETIIIRHKDNFATVYTHLQKRLVKIDRNVKKGETIAITGEKDDTGDVYMNFEIRFKGKAQNPLLFLP